MRRANKLNEGTHQEFKFVASVGSSKKVPPLSLYIYVYTCYIQDVYIYYRSIAQDAVKNTIDGMPKFLLPLPT